MNLLRELRAFSPWPAALGLLMATGWLLPNHYPPWNTFHTNAWIGAALLLVALWRVRADAGPVALSAPAAVLAFVALVPWLQHASGLVPLRSDALLSSLHMLGAAVAFMLGERWSRARAESPAGFVLMAASVAAVFCVGLQIYQWLGLAVAPGWRDFWIFPSGVNRPYANFGQPNQLASLLLWGLLGLAWAWHKGFIRAPMALAFAVFVLFGVALTESRSAALTLTLAVVALSIWRPAFLQRRQLRAAQGLYLLYLVLLFSIEPLGRLHGQEGAELSIFGRSAGELRGTIWRMALDAASQRPWAGYGWKHTNAAFLEVFPRHQELAQHYLEHSHNLLLDLVLWAGIPFGLACLVAGAWWLLRVARAVTDLPRLITLAALFVMLIHAMLELPLHHGYFLWPFAVIAGSASASVQWPSLLQLPRRAAAAGLVALAALTGVIAHDYFHVEEAFKELRFQLLRIGRGHDETPPRTVLLTDWNDFIRMMRTPPTAGMSAEEIQRWQDLLIYNTSPLAFRKVVGALTLNGREQEAQYWAVRSCTVLAAVQCKAVATEWSPAAAQTAP